MPAFVYFAVVRGRRYHAAMLTLMIRRRRHAATLLLMIITSCLLYMPRAFEPCLRHTPYATLSLRHDIV